MMQQKQKKNETQKKTGTSIASLMAKRDKEKLLQQNKQSYIEQLKKPRSKEYLKALADFTESCKRLEEIEKELAKLEQEAAQENALLSEVGEQYEEKIASAGDNRVVNELPKEEKETTPSWMMEEPAKPATPAWTMEEPAKPVTPAWTMEEPAKPATPAWAMEEPAKPATPAWAMEEPAKAVTPAWIASATPDTERLAKLKEKQQRIAQLNAEREKVAAELKEAQQRFEASIPVPEKIVGIIYPEIKRDILLKYGVIACPGERYHSKEELLAQVQPQSEKEKQQWLKGDDAYWKYVCSELLLVEIYMDVICVVYDDGSVKTLED